MYIKIRAKTGVKQDHIREIKKDYFEISVKEKPERNMANKKILELISEHFKVPIGKVRIISGHHSPSKILSIDI